MRKIPVSGLAAFCRNPSRTPETATRQHIMPDWLHWVSVLSLIVGAISAIIIAVDEKREPPRGAPATRRGRFREGWASKRALSVFPIVRQRKQPTLGKILVNQLLVAWLPRFVGRFRASQPTGIPLPRRQRSVRVGTAERGRVRLPCGHFDQVALSRPSRSTGRFHRPTRPRERRQHPDAVECADTPGHRTTGVRRRP